MSTSIRRGAPTIQFIKFLLVGVSNTLLSEAIYAVLVLLGVNYLLANTIGFIISVLNAFFWSNRFVFKEDENAVPRVWWQTLLKTYAAYFWGFLVNLALLFFWVDVVEIARFMDPVRKLCVSIGWTGAKNGTIAELLAEGVNLLLTVPMNFLINKYWAFRQKRKEEAE